MTRKAKRTQADGKQPDYSRRSALHCHTKSLTRQEDRDAADINKILQRFGVGAPQRQGTLGKEVNYDLDLQTSLNAIADVKKAWRGLPANLRSKYPSWQSLLNAIDQGRLVLETEEPKERVTPKPEEKKDASTPNGNT